VTHPEAQTLSASLFGEVGKLLSGCVGARNLKVEHGYFECCAYSSLRRLLRVGPDASMTPNVNYSQCWSWALV